MTFNLFSEEQGTMMKYARNVANWAAQEGVEVIILSGLDSGKRQRNEINVYVTSIMYQNISCV